MIIHKHHAVPVSDFVPGADNVLWVDATVQALVIGNVRAATDVDGVGGKGPERAGRPAEGKIGVGGVNGADERRTPVISPVLRAGAQTVNGVLAGVSGPIDHPGSRDTDDTAHIE